VGKKISRLRANAERASVQACSPCSLPGGYRGVAATQLHGSNTGVVRELHESSTQPKQEDRDVKQDGRSRSGRGQNGEIADKRIVVGRVQRQVRRAFIASDGRPLQIGDLLARCYPGTTDHPVWHRTNVHRALPKFAVSLGRTNAQGRPIMWAPNPELIRLIGAHTENPKNS
jgi:hypothetical protein